jgi:hypothetical protein
LYSLRVRGDRSARAFTVLAFPFASSDIATTTAASAALKYAEASDET